MVPSYFANASDVMALGSVQGRWNFTFSAKLLFNIVTRYIENKHVKQPFLNN